MEWNVLAVGDVVAGCGVSMIEKHLPQLRRQVKADFTVVNGENLAAGRSAPTWTTVPGFYGRPTWPLSCQVGGGASLTPPWGRLR